MNLKKLARDSVMQHLQSLSDDAFLSAVLGDKVSVPLATPTATSNGSAAVKAAPKKRGRKPKAVKLETNGSNGEERPLAHYAILSSFKGESPFAVGDVMDKLGLSRAQASAALKMLVASGKLKKTGKLRGTVYHNVPSADA